MLGLPALLLVVLTFHLVLRPDPVAQAPRPGVVASSKAAELTRAHRCVWGDADAALVTGTTLAPGRTLELRKGLAELTFADGSTVVLEGPATFDTVSASRGFLRLGRLVARVPQGAEGFAIETPAATLVDLGTCFGVDVKEDETVESHVFQGKIEVTVRREPGTSLSRAFPLAAGQAARITKAPPGRPPVVRRFAANQDRFVHRVPEPPTVRFVHQGGANPVGEGWALKVFRSGKPSPEKPGPKSAGSVTGDGTAAWRLRNDMLHREIQYRIGSEQGLTPEIAHRAMRQGWVLRARIKTEMPVPGAPAFGFASFVHDGHSWLILVRPQLDGSQELTLRGASSRGRNARIAFPNSHGRYVDYEIRFNPETKQAQVFVDGRQVATRYRFDGAGAKTMIKFGLQARKGQAEFASVEWRILKEGESR